jgi:catechol 2,3-dioxygenase-like lactoylglutathione lyase family enzyme
MTVHLNHTIVEAQDRDATADFLVEILGLAKAGQFGPFRVVELGNDVSLDVMQADGPVHPQHYAFLVGEDEFDAILARIEERGLAHWADPGRSRPGINTLHGGRGVYFEDPYGNLLEAITRPYSGIP